MDIQSFALVFANIWRKITTTHNRKKTYSQSTSPSGGWRVSIFEVLILTHSWNLQLLSFGDLP